MFKKKDDWIQISLGMSVPPWAYFIIDVLGAPLTYLAGKDKLNFEITAFDILMCAFYLQQKLTKNAAKNELPPNSTTISQKEVSKTGTTEVKVTTTP